MQVERKDEPLDRATYLDMQSHLSLVYIVFQASCVWPFLGAACYYSVMIIFGLAKSAPPIHRQHLQLIAKYGAYTKVHCPENREQCSFLVALDFNSRLIPIPYNTKLCLSSFYIACSGC